MPINKKKKKKKKKKREREKKKKGEKPYPKMHEIVFCKFTDEIFMHPEVEENLVFYFKFRSYYVNTAPKLAREMCCRGAIRTVDCRHLTYRENL